ncbi:MAG: outer membrane protein [Candidatus Zixiibacteriota bacterium]
MKYCWNLRAISQRASLVTLTLLSALLATPAEGIVRVQAPPEVGIHVFEANLGLSGSLEEAAAGEDISWSAGWSYHANNTLGFGVMLGSNRPEEFDGTLFDGPTVTPGTFENKFEYITANVHVRAPTRSGFVPRLQAGFGYYQIDFEFRPLSPGGFSERVDQGEFGMSYGVGVDYLLGSSLAVGVIGNYHLISVDDRFAITGVLGDWYDSWDLKAVISVYSR